MSCLNFNYTSLSLPLTPSLMLHLSLSLCRIPVTEESNTSVLGLPNVEAYRGEKHGSAQANRQKGTQALIAN